MNAISRGFRFLPLKGEAASVDRLFPSLYRLSVAEEQTPLHAKPANERKYSVHSTGVLKRFYDRATISEALAPPVRNMARQSLATVPLLSAASAL
jgi:hypothetical protein